MLVVSVVGARPQFIKAAAVSPHLRRMGTEILVHTGQHYDFEMSEIFFKGMDLPAPDYNLGVGSGTHAQQTARILLRIEKLLKRLRPGLVLVYGDTNSTLGGAVAAAKLHIPVAHVEAGARSFNREMPEEINRVIADHVSDLLFCSTERTVRNLEAEGISAGVHRVGDVMLDTALRYGRMDPSILEDLGLGKGGYILLTCHRPSNTDVKENLRAILSAMEGYNTIFPAHPRTRKYMRRFRLEPPEGMRIIEPVGYVEMLALIKNARVLVTDSGGAQKEAYFFKVPCITLRKETEWAETVEDGWNVLVGAHKEKIREALACFKPRGRRRKHYGDGRAGERIARIVMNYTSATRDR
ncbi:MAG: UDP-N-acetylglucosamine 2-epimerase (non-hydrolyzing) [Candidatus Thermoplasmatota archaeon]